MVPAFVMLDCERKKSKVLDLPRCDAVAVHGIVKNLSQHPHSMKISRKYVQRYVKKYVHLGGPVHGFQGATS